MSFTCFDDFFRQATGVAPFPYQSAFATSKDLFELVHAPTGAGKTATAILGWLWRRRYAEENVRDSTPRRLAYCLPMRVLVEQTRDSARTWVGRLGLNGKVEVYVLMGGEDAEDWDLGPEADAILIGTQDMLLSRALDRGYGMSRFRWPMHFGLLNNDCLWVLDEVQLMGVGLATSAQLQAFRERFGTFGNVKTVWMSATLRADWLATVDFRDRVPRLSAQGLRDEDRHAPGLQDRWTAAKPTTRAGPDAKDTGAIAAIVKQQHAPGSLTLVVVNTVERSRALFEAIRGLYYVAPPKGRGKGPREPTAPASAAPDLKLIHSRFRPMERDGWMDWLTADPPAEGRIVVSTQVVEAGVDISARTLVTELAPWPSLVQRFGRCNRRGEFGAGNPAQIYWIDVPAKDDKQAAPYSKAELDDARKYLQKLDDAGLGSLHAFLQSLSDDSREALFPFAPAHVVRWKDLSELFDTTPDLAGNDIDVARFIREGDELDVQVFWRPDPPPCDELGPREARRIAPVRTELCPVSVGSFREFLTTTTKTAYRWDALNGSWERARSDAAFPGQVFWLPQNQGGYSRELGWDPSAQWESALEVYDPPEDADVGSLSSEPEYDSDLLSLFGWRSIAEHTDDVMTELEECIARLAFQHVRWGAVRVAVRWHDWGKAHGVFQDAISDDPWGDHRRPRGRAGRRDIAKAAPKEFWRKYARRHFRHELASAIGVLTLLRAGRPPTDWAGLSPAQQDLALYLIAAHHGKVRLSIRSMPNERMPGDPERVFARGVWQGDELPGVELGNGMTAPLVGALDLSAMKLGRGTDGSPSWAERVLGLRDSPDFGPFKLAFLEAVLRAADIRASAKADQKARR
jgi:CRISPR-associated endonuclease/helicase Cas3